MSNLRICDDCNESFPLDRTNCPHCARPQLFPNVSYAQKADEQEKLKQRYTRVKETCERSGRGLILNEFETNCQRAVAVFNAPLAKMVREFSTGTQIFETYYDLERLRLRSEIPSPHDWQRLRPQAEIELLGSEKHINQIHYAALSLDGNGLESYGDCTIRLKEKMIAHRSTCFEGNSALIFKERHEFGDCLRSSWNDRAKLCVAKYALNLSETTTCDKFTQMLLHPGPTQDADEFVEVHVFGTMTAQTIESVTIKLGKMPTRNRTLWKAVKEKLQKCGVLTCET